MSRKNDIINAVIKMLLPMKKTAENGQYAADVVVADAKVIRFLSGAGGRFPLPLVAVAYAGSPKTATDDTARVRHEALRVVAVFLITEDRGGLPSEMTAPGAGLHDLSDQVEDLLAGATPYLTRASGVYPDVIYECLKADGVTVTTQPAVDGVPIGHPLECIGDEPVPLEPSAAGKGLVAWSVGFRFLQAWMPDRTDVTDGLGHWTGIEGTVGIPDPAGTPGETEEDVEIELEHLMGE